MTSSSDPIVCLFAHQDDEYCASPRIQAAVREGAAVFVAFLSDGQGLGTPSARRNSESRAALESLGVRPERIAFAGSEHGIRDGTIWEHFDDVLELVRGTMRSWNIDGVSRIYTMAWEGGHADHDALHLIALAFSHEAGSLGSVWEVPAYHGRGVPDKLFRMMSPLHWSPDAEVRKLSPIDGVRAAFFCRYYPSQRRSWVGLFPEAFVKYAVLRRDFTQPADPHWVLERPHDGPLLYERMRRASYEEIAAAARRSVGVGAAIRAFEALNRRPIT